MKKSLIVAVTIAIILLGIGSYFLFFYGLEKESSVNTCFKTVEERLLFEEKISVAPTLNMSIKDYKKFETKEEALKFIEGESFEVNYDYPKTIQFLKDNNFEDSITLVVISSTFKTELKNLCSVVTPEECAKAQEAMNQVFIFPAICIDDLLVDSSLVDIKWFAGRTFEYDSETNERVYTIGNEEIRKKIE